MDGRGRQFEPLNTGATGRADARARQAPGETGTGPGRRVLQRLASLTFGALPFTRYRDPARRSRPRNALERLERQLPRFVGLWLALGFFGTTAVAGLAASGQITQFFEERGRPHHIAAQLFGFGISEIAITGLIQLREREILDAAGIDPRVALPFLNVTTARESLESLPLVHSATVRKLYPDGVVINIVEREPYALWQVDGDVYVIAMDGEVIDYFRPDPRYLPLPQVVGEGAQMRLAEYFELIDSAGALSQRIRAGTLVSERRWTLKLDNGMDVRLPENDPVKALQRLARLDAAHDLLEKDVIAIDLRMPDRVVVRLTAESWSTYEEEMRKRPLRGREVRT